MPLVVFLGEVGGFGTNPESFVEPLSYAAACSIPLGIAVATVVPHPSSRPFLGQAAQPLRQKDRAGDVGYLRHHGNAWHATEGHRWIETSHPASAGRPIAGRCRRPGTLLEEFLGGSCLPASHDESGARSRRDRLG
jgi:hypothetical protein